MHISPSNKKYIGITSKKPIERWQNGKGYRENIYFTRAIKKYGFDNFQHIIIAKGLTKDEAEWLEIELIREWDTTNKNKGYNIALGGKGSKGCNHTEEWKKEHSERMSGKGNPMFGNCHTENTKEKIRKGQIERLKNKENHPMYEQHHTEDAKERIREANSGANNHGARKVICITTNEIFLTVKEGAEKYNCCRSQITKCCKGKYKSCGKHPITNEKLVWMYYEDYLEMLVDEI